VSRLVVVSYRLGTTDGVSIEAAKWIGAFRHLGHDVATCAGEGVADTVIPELAMHATSPLRGAELDGVLEGADVVIIENVVSLPFNVAARDVLYEVLADRCAILHHHDLAWQRPQWRDEPAPRDATTWRHVTINDHSRDELGARGVNATTIRNHFDCDPPLGRRAVARKVLSVGDERLCIFPSRAIPRKNVEGALALATSLDAALWIVGDAEDGYDETLESLMDAAPIRVIHGLPARLDIHDAYAASDLVVVPSTWEGFGNPVLESVTHRRPLAVYPYPVLKEIRSYGFDFFDLDDVAAIEGFLDEPDAGLFDRNVAIARANFNLADLPGRLSGLLGTFEFK
jgi:glycosyltransferase involved in cell wall biosynthesis